jgi:hypothetical protein
VIRIWPDGERQGGTLVAFSAVDPFDMFHHGCGGLLSSCLVNPVFRRRLAPVEDNSRGRDFRDKVCGVRDSVHTVWWLLIGDEFGQLLVSWFRASERPLLDLILVSWFGF